ncbi:MAG: Photosystem I assembly protein Ycf3 [candidate division WS2 bacterium]|uniref:Photosystem I assembly protein Ycf3 n=1 Tax=Psychracetigena formicireducens TaxID=2986056 RepID=A0A9E2BI40_PSYF1|nr:Photosystem I assembly protein Ycf3 [Candidatus Psychracetigena formicireducens]
MIYKRTVKTALPKPPAEHPKDAAPSQSKKTLLEIARLPEMPVEIKKPDAAEEYFMRGLKYESKKKYKDAAEAYKKSLKIKPHYVDAYLNLGQVHYKLGKYSEAVDVYKQALKMRPDMQTYNKLGTLYIISGKYSEAIDTFEQAIGIDSRNPDAHFNLGIAYFLSGDKDAAYEEYIILNRLDGKLAEELFDLLYR